MDIPLGHFGRAMASLVAEKEAAKTPDDRGRLVLSMVSTVRNLKSENILDIIETVFDGDTWRDYTYPNGDHFEFRAREFDYFLAQIDVDPQLVREACRNTSRRDLEARLVEASLTRVDEERRSVEEITATYPQLGPWLDKYGVRTLGNKMAYGAQPQRARLAVGEAPQGKRYYWSVAVASGPDVQVEPSREDYIRKIAEKLVKDGLAEEVAKACSTLCMQSILHCARCGTEFTPTSNKGTPAKYCSDTCKRADQTARQRAKKKAAA